MKILNLYAGIGGNRKFWGDEHEMITAVENVDAIADVYAHFWPNDTLIRADAHQYLLDHYREFDFIWSLPPCPTHSKTNTFLNPKGYVRYPDMGLYVEIVAVQRMPDGSARVGKVFEARVRAVNAILDGEARERQATRTAIVEARKQELNWVLEELSEWDVHAPHFSAKLEDRIAQLSTEATK